jgi:hypothetical protein
MLRFKNKHLVEREVAERSKAIAAKLVWVMVGQSTATDRKMLAAGMERFSQLIEDELRTLVTDMERMPEFAPM